MRSASRQTKTEQPSQTCAEKEERAGFWYRRDIYPHIIKPPAFIPNKLSHGAREEEYQGACRLRQCEAQRSTG